MTRPTLLGVLLCMVALYTTGRTAQAEGADSKALGQVHFATSCSAEAQTHFNRAVALLHAFWFSEAIKTFNMVLATDASCAMGYWGLAMSLLGNPLAGPPTPQALQEGEQVLREGKPVGVRTEREYEYIAAVSLLYKDTETTEPRARALAYERAMERLASRYTNDPEATIFYALALNMTAEPTDKTSAKPLKAAALLEKIFAKQPQHPGVAHYLMHSYDSPSMAEKGLPAARRYASLAPATPYALHMPSHIFTRLGLWQESIVTNRASAAVAKEELRATQAGQTGSYNALHAMDYMLYGHLQLAQDQAAKRLLDEVQAMQQLDVEQFGAAYAFAAIPARYALERRRWDEASTLTLHPTTLNWQRFPSAEAVTVFAHGLGTARSGNVAAARQDMTRLQRLRDAMLKAGQKSWAEQTDIQRQMVAAWVAKAEGKNDEAVKLLRSAAHTEAATEKPAVTPGPLVPARELLGELLLELNQAVFALQAYEASLKAEPNRFRGLYGAARAAEVAGDRAKARLFYGKLVALGQQADSERPEIVEAKTFLAQAP